MLTRDLIRRLPKVDLHNHLDGALRLKSIIELAKEGNVTLPTYDEIELAAWFARGATQKNLPLYLENFQITTSVMQSKVALYKVAVDMMEDLKAENVVYSEVRFAPILHTQGGLSLEEVVMATLEGLNEGKRRTGVSFGLILSAMRNQEVALSLKVAQLAVAFRNHGVVGFDLAGDESGHPPKEHLEAFQYIRNHNFNITIHAGEGFGVESIWQAVQVCGAHRIGHGTRLVEDMAISGTRIEKMGSLAHFIKDRRIPLEMCLTSNIDTGAAEDIASHPFNVFFRNNFRAFLCTDNRLMSNTTLTKEFELAVNYYGFTLHDIEKTTINAMKSAFIHHNEKIRIIFDVIKKGYADIREALNLND
ncbi:MAG: adenosine deaminase [Sphaerochaetaceae bacterium]